MYLLFLYVKSLRFIETFLKLSMTSSTLISPQTPVQYINLIIH